MPFVPPHSRFRGDPEGLWAAAFGVVVSSVSSVNYRSFPKQSITRTVFPFPSARLVAGKSATLQPPRPDIQGRSAQGDGLAVEPRRSVHVHRILGAQGRQVLFWQI